MAGLDARTDSFVSMLLDVTGRVRPGDLPAISEFDLPATLQAYVDAHPERQLTLDGSVLSLASAPAAPVAAAAPAAPIAVAAPAVPVAVDPPAIAAIAPESVEPAAAAREPEPEPEPELVFQTLPLDDTPETAPPPPSVSQAEEAPEVDPASWFIAPSADLAPPEGSVIPPAPGDQPGPSDAGVETEKSYEF